MYPKFVRELFENEGAGPLIRDEIIPTVTSEVADQLADLEERISDNETDIETLQGEATAKWVILNNVQAYQTGTVTPFIAATTPRLTAIESSLADKAATADLQVVAGGVATNATAITNLQSADTALAARVTTNETAITGLKAADVGILARIDAIEAGGTGGGGGTGDVTTAQLQAVADRVTINETAITDLQTVDMALTARVVTNETNIGTANTRLDALEAGGTGGVSEVTAAQFQVLVDRVDALEALLGDVDTALDTIIGEEI